MSESENKTYLKNLQPKQSYGIYQYPHGSTVSGLITQDIRELEKQGKLKILKEWVK